MAVKQNGTFNRRVRKNTLRILKATLKAVIVYLIYVAVARLLVPISSMIPGFQEMIATFVAVYIALMVIADLASGTIFQHFFKAARSLFVVVYLIFSLNSGILEYTFGNVNLIVDLRMFLVIVMLLELLGLANSMVQAINSMSERAEIASVQT